MPDHAAREQHPTESPRVPLATIAGEWGRIGCVGFGGPPAHIALLRKLCVEDRQWLPPDDFEDGLAACNLLPGPASTQLAIFCAWRLRGPAGAILGGVCFIVPGLVIILGLSAFFLAPRPPGWIAGAAAGSGAAVPAVAVAAAAGLIAASWRRAGGSNPETRAAHGRWIAYLVAGGVAAATVGPWLVIVLAACGLAEVATRTRPRFRPRGPGSSGPESSGPGSSGPGASGAKPPGLGAALLPLAAAVPAAAGLLTVAWEGFKVGALSYGGGFVIIPLMQHDAVDTYHWMTAGQFLSAVALGQITPGPVVQTVAVVGYAAAGVGGGLLAALVAFTPSFLFVLGGGRYFDRLRASAAVQAFLTGAGPAAIGAITGAAVPLALALAHLWQLGVLALAAAWLLGARRGVVTAIVGAAGLGVLAFAAGAPVG
ncbi:MAG: chromate efflux transporter [Streptosporangiaceae bacterium]